MKTYAPKTKRFKAQGSVLVATVFLLVILSIFSLGVLKSAEGAHMQSIREKRQTAALAAAEAAYEKAVFSMSLQNDLLSTLASGSLTENLTFPDSSGTYTVNLASFMQSKPVFEITAVGSSGIYHKTIRTYLVQAVNGWAMGRCQVPTGTTDLTDVFFVTGEVIDMPIEVNKQNDSPDVKDIKIQGTPQFLQMVSLGEPRHTETGQDKYLSSINCFSGGIVFDQPQIRISDETIIETKIERFKNSTDPLFRFTPSACGGLANPQPTVHLEFFVENGKGKIRITNHCTVRGFRQDADLKTYDYRIKPGTGGEQFERYYIYAYHVRNAEADANGDRFVADLEDTYVCQDFGGFSSQPGGQIFVDGNVIIGSGQPDLGDLSDTVQGQVMVVATGNVWIGDSVTVSDKDDLGQTYARQGNGMPGESNPNVLGLMSQGVIRVVDPGMTAYSYVDTQPIEPAGFEYVPIGRPDDSLDPDDTDRHLPDPMVVEASVTVGGGGWGAENLKRSYYGGRKESGTDDHLVLRGNITEAVRGIVGVVGMDGYTKMYYWDPRLQTGILPGNIWLKGKYVPVPGGWRETQYVQGQ